MPDSESLNLNKTVENVEDLPKPSLEDFARHRRLLQSFCELHIRSVEHFSGITVGPTGTRTGFPIYRLTQAEPPPDKFRHMTSSATCFSSVLDCPDRFVPKGSIFAENARQFAVQALPHDNWKSDGSADIYCRCRGLPFVLSQLRDDDLQPFKAKIYGHLDVILGQLKKDRARASIGEADPRNNGKVEDWYPPNAYHTYWTIQLFDVLKECSSSLYEEFSSQLRDSSELKGIGLDLLSSQLKKWARQTLGYQVSLHSADSSTLDSDQLAWSLALVIREPDEYLSKLPEQDFIRHAFRCLFSTQTEIGTWRHYAPLFHYTNTGNAYCYVFETFAALLKEALKPKAEFVRSVLKTHFWSLIRLFEYAKTTQTPLDSKNTKLGWSSGHRTNQPIESWATASVFAYAQNLRRLVGIWAREEAMSHLNRPRTFSQDDAVRKLQERSQIWRSDGPSLEEQIWTMFINPAYSRGDERTEPDKQPIREDCPRSAILFGPPGTSKTTLVRSLAGCVQWDYVELHASHFVADGLPNVQKTADRIFKQLDELDHVVVLFDEIDELVRERDIEKDAFGRFLTTSMLPKLAELWEARKIMYFVATNHIEYFDKAIIRSQRFDAVLFVSPPSFDSKVGEITKILRRRHEVNGEITFQVTKEDVERAFTAFSSFQLFRSLSESLQNTWSHLKGKVQDEPGIPRDAMLAKFVLLRFDELGELALNLKGSVREGLVVTEDILVDALSKIQDGRWRGPSEYSNYLRGPSYQRLDLTKEHVWFIKQRSEGVKSEYITEWEGKAALVARVRSLDDISIKGYKLIPVPQGQVEIVKA